MHQCKKKISMKIQKVIFLQKEEMCNEMEWKMGVAFATSIVDCRYFRYNAAVVGEQEQ